VTVCIWHVLCHGLLTSHRALIRHLPFMGIRWSYMWKLWRNLIQFPVTGCAIAVLRFSLFGKFFLEPQSLCNLKLNLVLFWGSWEPRKGSSDLLLHRGCSMDQLKCSWPGCINLHPKGGGKGSRCAYNIYNTCILLVWHWLNILGVVNVWLVWILHVTNKLFHVVILLIFVNIFS